MTGPELTSFIILLIVPQLTPPPQISIDLLNIVGYLLCIVFLLVIEYHMFENAFCVN